LLAFVGDTNCTSSFTLLQTRLIKITDLLRYTLHNDILFVIYKYIISERECHIHIQYANNRLQRHRPARGTGSLIPAMLKPWRQKYLSASAIFFSDYMYIVQIIGSNIHNSVCRLGGRFRL